MASCGLDRETGLPLYDLDHVCQHVLTIFETRLGSLIMARGYGGGLVELLGRRALPRLVAFYRYLLALAIATWEPRLKIAAIDMAGTVPDEARVGQLRFQVWAYYRPRGHLGDLTVEGGLRGFTLAASDRGLTFALDRPVVAPANP